MRNLCVLSDALNYIEEHLTGELSQSDIAAHCHCSLSSLQKLFRYTFNISVGDYVSRRRLTCCARELVLGDRTILDIAMDYGYNSAEVFTRAFARVWGETPAAFRKKRRFSGIFPKLTLNQTETGGQIMSRKYDFSELYDYFIAHAGTYIIAFDIKSLTPINALSRKAGDIAIREAFRRIDEAAGEDMLLFRVGGDEFALATGLSDEAAVDAIADAVMARNGETFRWEEYEISLSLYAAEVKLEGRGVRYSELYPALDRALDAARRAEAK